MTVKNKPNAYYYYGAYDIIKGDGNLVGIAYVKTGVRGGRKAARWLHPTNKLVSSHDRKRYRFYFMRSPFNPIDWIVDGIQREQGRHLELNKQEGR